MASTVLCLLCSVADQAAGAPGHTRVVCTEECCKCFAVFRLDEALSHYFGEGAEAAQQEAIYPSEPEPIKKCPQCNRDMVLKTKKSGGSVPACAPVARPAVPGPTVSFLGRYLKAACCGRPPFWAGATPVASWDLVWEA